MLDNKRFGISVGHNDTDNIVRNNQVLRSGKVGIYLARSMGRLLPQPESDRSQPCRDSGGETGVAVDIEGVTESVLLKRNVLLETRQPAGRVGVRISKEAKQIALAENRIDGFSTPVVDLGK